MSSKNNVDVVIGGQVFTVCGYESKEYLQKVSDYINGKLSECTKDDNYRKLSNDVKNKMMYLNIADDYFKMKRLADTLTEEVQARNDDVCNLKHQIISEEIKTESALKEIEALKEEINKYQQTIVKLETELKTRK